MKNQARKKEESHTPAHAISITFWILPGHPTKIRLPKKRAYAPGSTTKKEINRPMIDHPPCDSMKVHWRVLHTSSYKMRDQAGFPLPYKPLYRPFITDYAAALADESIKRNAFVESERMVAKKRVNTLYSPTIRTFFQICLAQRATSEELPESGKCCFWRVDS